MGSPLQSLLLAVLCLSPLILPVANGALSVNQESEYLASFDDMISASYSEPRPNELTSACAARGSNTVTNRVSISGGITTASQVSALCGADDICVIEAGSTLQMSSSLVQLCEGKHNPRICFNYVLSSAWRGLPTRNAGKSGCVPASQL